MSMQKGETPQAAHERLERELLAQKFLVVDLQHQLRLTETSGAALLGASQKRERQYREYMSQQPCARPENFTNGVERRCGLCLPCQAKRELEEMKEEANMRYKLYRYDESGKCQDCGLMDNHSNACHDTAPFRMINQILERMSSLYSYLSLLRHRHIPAMTDPHLIREIDAALANGEQSLKGWWTERSRVVQGKTQA